MGAQGHHQHHGLGFSQPIEDGAFAGAERLVIRVADEAFFCAWIPILPWPVWPLAGSADWGRMSSWGPARLSSK